jgi:diacylglycerol kinase family enzyme
MRTDDAVTFTCDLGEALVDGRLFRFVAHVQARRQWWRGRAWVAMNASWLGSWNLAPRSHPNDGLLDVLDVRLRPSELLAARARVRTGAHVPHPRITERRAPAIQVGLEQPTPVLLDGLPVGDARNLSLRVEPDALTVVV